MTGSDKWIRLTGGMRYGEAKALMTSAWPRLHVIVYAATVEHFKEGRPTAEELELAADALRGRNAGREAVLRGDMTGQDLLTPS